MVAAREQSVTSKVTLSGFSDMPIDVFERFQFEMKKKLKSLFFDRAYFFFSRKSFNNNENSTKIANFSKRIEIKSNRSLKKAFEVIHSEWELVCLLCGVVCFQMSIDHIGRIWKERSLCLRYQQMIHM